MYGKDGVSQMNNKISTNGKYTEAFVPVKSITNGTIVLDNNQKVAGVKIMPKNIFILDYNSMMSTITGIKDLYNMIDYEFWIVVADRPVDIHVYLSQLELLYNNVQSPMRRKVIIEDINKANMFMNNNIVDTEYYLLFKEKDNDLIQKRIRNLIQQFANAGMTAQQTSNEDLRIILDNFLNGGQTTNFGTVIG
jgi:hypothetical protein